MQRELNNIDKEIEVLSRVLTQVPPHHPHLRLLLTRLANTHNRRFNLLEEPHDILKTIECKTIVLTLTPDDDPGLADLLTTLGIAHGKRFQRTGDMNDLEKGIEYMSIALSMMPDGHPDLARQLANLAVSHKDRFGRLGELDDIEKALEYNSRAVDVTTKDDPDLPVWLEQLGTSHIYRLERLGNLDDLEKAIECQSRGVALAPDGYSRLPDMLGNLAISYKKRFELLGELGDLEQAIKHESHAVTLTPDGHPHLSRRLINLGESRRDRFERLGELSDLEQAIEYQSRAVALTPDGHPRLSTRLASLGVSHSDRFKHLGELNDLEKAKEYYSRALDLTPDGHPEMSRYLSNLGVSHSQRFQRLGEQNDLKQAIAYQYRALAITPDGHPHLKTYLTNLGTFHSRRFEYLGELSDVEQAIKYQTCALTLTPDGHINLSRVLVNLGASHNDRFQLLGDRSDLDKAIGYQLRALRLTNDNDPDLCQIHFNLALYYIQDCEHTNSSSHLQDSLHSFRIASKSLVGAPRHRFRCAHRWATHASRYPGLSCIEAYQTTIGLLPQFIWLGATTAQRYEDLKMAATLAVDAATAAINSSNYSLALEWLEHARCVVWNQNLMLRSPIDQLAASHPSLATRLLTVSHELHNAGSESKESRAVSTGLMTPEKAGQQHRRLAKEYNELLNEARSFPGFEDFLQPIKSTRLVCASHIGPIIAIVCQEDRCNALIVLPKQDNIKNLCLPNFTAKKAQGACSMIETSLRRKGLRERGVHIRQKPGERDGFGRALTMLWVDLVKPLLDFLGYTGNAPTGNLPHITWCPTGAASFLPLHAAGDYDQPHSRVFDYVISSYTPTLTALLESTPSTLGPSSRVLAIGQEVTPGHKSLPGTKTEVGYVKAHVEVKTGYLQLMDAEATPSAVLDAMEQHDWVHLACHAHQNVYDPTKSGFFLHNGPLDLAAINRRSFKKKGLAFLSACQTARGDETLPDEAVHLASGMLMAGYSSVIATMWSVVDVDAPFVADKVYGQLMVHGKLGDGEAGKALHNAVAGLRNKIGEKEFERWVPYIHIGA